MKKLIIGTLTAAVLGLSSVAYAATETSIGVMDMRTLFEKSTRMQALSDSLKKQFDPQKNKLVADQKALRDEQEKFNNDSAKMKDDERNKARDALLAKAQSLQAKEQKFLEAVQEKQTSAMKKSLDEISSIVEDVAKKKNFSLILQSGTVVYADQALDITSDVMKKFDSKK